MSDVNALIDGIVTLASMVGSGVAGAIGEDAWSKTKRLLGLEASADSATVNHESIGRSVESGLERNPCLVDELRELLDNSLPRQTLSQFNISSINAKTVMNIGRVDTLNID
jgi:hypothetical protein